MFEARRGKLNREGRLPEKVANKGLSSGRPQISPKSEEKLKMNAQG